MTKTRGQSFRSGPMCACEEQLFLALDSSYTGLAGSFVLRTHAVIKRTQYKYSSRSAVAEL